MRHQQLLAMLFPGQGGYYPGCLNQIEGFSVEAAAIGRQIDSVAHAVLRASLKDACGKDGPSELIVRNPMALQLALYAAACMTTIILEARGVRPNLAIGHSFGEIAALAHAGAFDWAEGARIVCDRTKALAARAPKDGAMLAVALPASRTQETLEAFCRSKSFPDLVVAVENHDSQTIVSGPRPQLASYAEAQRACGVSTTFLASPYGFHHPALAEAALDFARRLRERRTSGVLRHQVWSPILGRAYGPQDDLLEILAQHLVMPVRFGAMARAAYEHGVRTVVECGASDALGRIVRRALQLKPEAEVRIFSVFPNASASLAAAVTITRILKETSPMNIDTAQAFEKFWRERSPYLLMNIKTEFEYFLSSTHLYGGSSHPIGGRGPADSLAAPAANEADVKPAPASAITASAPPAPRLAIGARGAVFQELATLYAEAMEYPIEVFTESAELEAELGIDSVKQTEIMGRASQLFALPPLPPDVRLGEYRTLGQITDLVLTHRDRRAAA